MNPGYDFTLSGARLTALGSGALWWAEHRVLCISDLHLGKSERIARRGGAALPPYETRDTLTKLAHDLERCNPQTVVALGDSFDDLGAADALPADERDWIAKLQAGRKWIWIEGNHDPGPVELGGEAHRNTRRAGRDFGALSSQSDAKPEGAKHLKARVRL
jgi:metallophosphoesterase superfamily enzyme